MRKLVSTNSEELNNLVTIQSSCRCVAYCTTTDPDDQFHREYYLHLDDNNSVVGGGLF